MTTPKLQMPELVVGQAGKELTHNQALAVLDQLAQAVVVDKDLASPPGSPANGSMYIVAAGATGAWSGQSGKLAYWLTTVAAWTFITPADGWSVWVTDEAVRYELLAGAWTIAASGGGGSGEVNTASNLGTGSGLFAGNVGVDLQFKSLKAGAGVTLSSTATEVTIVASGAGGAVDSVNGQTGVVALDTDDIVEGATNKYFTEGRVRSTVMTGLSLLTGGVISAADSVLSALGKLQKQVSDAVTAIGGKQDTLVSGTNIKTVNGSSLLGSGNLSVAGGGGLAAFDVVAAEALAAGDFVNIYTDTGVAKARKADGGAAKRKAHGFVEASVLISATASVTPLGGDNSALSGLTPGGEYFLSTTTPGSVQSTAPNGSGLLRQTIGVAVSATQLTTINGFSVELA